MSLVDVDSCPYNAICVKGEACFHTNMCKPPAASPAELPLSRMWRPGDSNLAFMACLLGNAGSPVSWRQLPLIMDRHQQRASATSAPQAHAQGGLALVVHQCEGTFIIFCKVHCWLDMMSLSLLWIQSRLGMLLMHDASGVLPVIISCFTASSGLLP